MDGVPVIDVAPLVAGGPRAAEVAREIDAACRRVGFFSVVGHGVDPSLATRLEALAREFLALPDEEKAGSRWRAAGGHGAAGSPSAVS